MRPPNGKRGRSRGRNKGHHGGGGGGGGGHNNVNRTLESNGPDVKIRGTAAHIHEKYLALARDSHSSGDRIAAENYMQHAEHYHRLLMSMYPQGIPVQGQQGQGNMNGNAGDGEGDDGSPYPQQGSFPNQGGYNNGNNNGNNQGGGYQNQNRDRGDGGYQNRDRGEYQNRGGDHQNQPQSNPQTQQPQSQPQPQQQPQPAQPAAQAPAPAQAQPRSDGEQALVFERRLNGRSRRVSGEDRSGRAATNIENEAPKAAPQTDESEGDDADEAIA